MIKFAGAYGSIIFVMVAIDLLWLGIIAKPLYQQGIGHLMAERPNMLVALLFYLIFAAGLLVFVVAPDGVSAGWGKTALAGALFGLVAYGTYDLTNLATLKNWPVGLAVLDMAAGSLVSALSATAGKVVFDRLGAA